MPEIIVYDNPGDKRGKAFRSESSVIEYCNSRPHEQFRVVVNGPSSMENIMKDIRIKLANNLRNARIV